MSASPESPVRRSPATESWSDPSFFVLPSARIVESVYMPGGWDFYTLKSRSETTARPDPHRVILFVTPHP